MEETEIIRGRINSLKPSAMVALFQSIVLAILIWTIQGKSDFFKKALIPFAIMLVILVLVSFIIAKTYLKKQKIIVTDKRIFGKATRNYKFDITYDKISSVILSGNNIRIKLESKAITFLSLENASDVYEEIRKRINVERTTQVINN